MEDKDILEAIRASGITKNQLTVMLTKFVVLMDIETKRAELARATASRDQFMAEFNAQFSEAARPHNTEVERLRSELSALEAQAAQTL